MQSSDTSISPGLAFPAGRKRRRGNRAEERVKGTGEVRIQAGAQCAGEGGRGASALAGRQGGQAVLAQPSAPTQAHTPSPQRGRKAVQEGWGTRDVEPTNPTVALRLGD